MELFGLGIGKLLLILVIALVVVGPERLPEVAAQLGRTVAEWRQLATHLATELHESLELAVQERQARRGTATGDVPACPHCGTPPLVGARFCMHCGTRLQT